MSISLQYLGMAMVNQVDCVSDGSEGFWAELTERLKTEEGRVKITGTLRGFMSIEENFQEWFTKNDDNQLRLDIESEEHLLLDIMRHMDEVSVACGRSCCLMVNGVHIEVLGDPPPKGESLLHQFLAWPHHCLTGVDFSNKRVPDFVLRLPAYSSLNIRVIKPQFQNVRDFLDANKIPLHFRIFPGFLPDVRTEAVHMTNFARLLPELTAASLTFVGYSITCGNTLDAFAKNCRCPFRVNVSRHTLPLEKTLLRFKPISPDVTIYMEFTFRCPQYLDMKISTNYEDVMKRTGNAIKLVRQGHPPFPDDVFRETREKQRRKKLAALVIGMDKYFGHDKFDELKSHIVLNFAMVTTTGYFLRGTSSYY